MGVNYVFLLILVYSSNCELTGPIEDVFQTLVDPEETLLFICEALTHDCVALMMGKNPSLIVDIERPIRGSLNGQFTYVLSTDNTSWLDSTLTKLTETILWHPSESPRGRFFIMSGNRNTKEISEIFLKHQIIDVTLLQKRQPHHDGLLINNISVAPVTVFYNYKVVEGVVQIPRINKINLLLPLPLFTLEDPFFKAVYGLPNKTIQLIANALNITAKCTHDKQWLELLKRRERTEIWLVVLNSYIFLNTYDCTESIFRDSHIWFLPRIKHINYNEAIVYIFKWQTWISILYTLVTIVLICWLLANNLNDHRSLCEITSWYLILIRLMLSTSCPKLPKTITLRVLIVFYIWYCMQISNLFQANLASVLTEPKTEPEIRSLEGLSKSSLLLLGDKNVKFVYENNSQFSVYKEIADKVMLYERNGTTTSQLLRAANNNYGIAMGAALLRHAYPQFVSKFYPLQHETMFALDQSFYIKKGHHFLKTLSFFSRAFNEGGFYHKMWTDMKWENVKNVVSKAEDAALGFQHLMGVFLIVLIGYLAAGMIFLAEVMYYYKWKIAFWKWRELDVAK